MVKRPSTRIIGSRKVGGVPIILVKTPKGETYLARGKSSRKAFGPTYRRFKIKRLK